MNGRASDFNNVCKKKPTATAKFFPLSGRRLVHRRTRAMQLRTAVGVVKLQVLHGQDPADEHWGCPVREHWGLTCHQQLSLALEDKLAFTLTATASYEEASALAHKWGSPVSGSALHALAQSGWGPAPKPAARANWKPPRWNASPNEPPRSWRC